MNKISDFQEVNEAFISALTYKRVALDASFLVKVFFQNLHNHKECATLLDLMRDQGVTFVANATVKSELLDFARKALLTEFLFNQIDIQDLKIPTDTKKLIKEFQTSKEELAKTQKSDLVLQDTELNYIRDHLSLFFDESDKDALLADPKIKMIRDHILPRQGISGISTWAKVCEVFLSGRIEQVHAQLKQSDIKYLSYDELKEKELLETGRTLDWDNAVKICEASGGGFWDSMLINFAETAKVDLVITLDKDLAYSYAASPSLKKNVLTTSKIKKFLDKVRL